jgi:hypothetical protein
MAVSISRAIRRFEQAVRDHALKGCAHELDKAHIQRTYEVTKKDLYHVLGLPEPKGE